ncbi:MAG TPA: heme lyase CcmF/NrfE family subunit [Bacillota bacterium]
MAELGRSFIWLALAVSAYGVAALSLGVSRLNGRLIKSGRAAAMVFAAAIVGASVVLLDRLVASDFSFEYVAINTNLGLPVLYKVSAFWAHNAGSLLLWTLVLGLYTAIVALSRYREDESAAMSPYVLAILLAIGAFFAYLLAVVASPFNVLPNPPTDGQGLNPLLQNPGMIIHPTTQYLGYAGFAVPFAFAMAALIIRRPDDLWLRITRRWTIVTWLFLSIGMIFGGQWAYVELGWGGYWGWDPVENASLMPWLTATAFLHSVMIQERRGMLKIWNVALIIVTFALTLFGTFLTRSGVLASVHAFGDSTLGAYLLAFIAASVLASLWLTLKRLPLLREEHQFEGLLSKESSFLANNLILVGGAFTVFWGTVFPLLSEAVTGNKVSVSAPYYNRVMVPIGLLLVALIGICPLIAWRKASLANLRRNFLYPAAASLVYAVGAFAYGIRSPGALIAYTASLFVTATVVLEVTRGLRARMHMTGETAFVALPRMLVKNRRRYGGYVVHLAVILMIVAIAGSHVYQIDQTKSIQPGETIDIGRYQLIYQGLGERDEGYRSVVFADLKVIQNGRDIGVLRPSKDFYPNQENPSTEVAVKGSLREDLYVILAGWEEGGRPTVFKTLVNPLVAWIWIGEYLLIAGTLFAVWPDRRRLAGRLG